MKRLIEGFKQFQRSTFQEQRALFEQLAAKQTPHTMIITCADSRVIPELFTSSGPGELFVCRNVGNIVPPYAQFTGGVSAAIEFAVMALEVKDIVICGHSDCGAMKALAKSDEQPGLPAVSAWLRHAHVAKRVVELNQQCDCAEDHLAVLTETNVIAQIDHIRTHPSVAARLAAGLLRVHGWVYDIETGMIRGYSAEQRRFVPIEELELPEAGTVDVVRRAPAPGSTQ
ncbi:carbonic anhydrase [Solimonas marina]|uniref:Carbonic anhydrase n=1 Tax=Solimonas marina TaxID=2714601 RepID=A0A969W785_9GAMM|nr:carbonic anhydrase [Solimonas marina]NKF20763.1 carbonic anhydrase [Solimonas marina]